MTQPHAKAVAAELGIRPEQVVAVQGLLQEGSTEVFIARYRKEATGSLDEVAVRKVRDRLEALAELDKRRAAIISSLEERGLLSEALRVAIGAAAALAELEDLYLPYRPKRRTRAMIASEKGLGPLAETIMDQKIQDPARAAREYVDSEKGVEDEQQALAGARDIIAERVSEDAGARAAMRALFAAKARLASRPARGMAKVDPAVAAKFRDWLDWDEPASSAAAHRILALLRGEREGVLSVEVRPDEAKAVSELKRRFVVGRGPCAEQVAMAVEDGYRRLLGPSMETEFRATLKQRADAEAIAVFAANLRELLLAPALGQKRIMALDPGLRTGAKLVCLDAQGKLEHYETVFPLGSERQATAAADRIRELARAWEIEAVAIGNGTGGRETEAFVRSLKLTGVAVVLVNESGASVYSGSDAAREEFPDLDLTVRGAVSIGRRLMDPLAELVKIDPKAIGVGQYQHDVDQAALKRALDDVVVSCVNAVGVELNTASAALALLRLGPRSGTCPQRRGQARGRGPVRFQAGAAQGASARAEGLRAGGGLSAHPRREEPLGRLRRPPERYGLVERMAKDLGVSVAGLMQDPGRGRASSLGATFQPTLACPP
jgi:protein Tex